MKAYCKRFIVEIHKAREYLLSFVSSMIYVPVSLVIYYFLFSNVMKENSNFSMSLQEIVSYYTIILFLKATLQHSMSEVYYVYTDINQGTLDIWLTKPTSYFFTRYFRALGSVSVTLPVGICLLITILWKNVHFINMILFLISAFFGFTVLFLMMFILGTLTFWLKYVLTIRDIFWFVLSIASGELIPLQMFPEFLQVMSYNPLACIYDIPYRIIMSGDSSLIGLQMFYILLLSLVSKIIWDKGVKHYESQGG